MTAPTDEFEEELEEQEKKHRKFIKYDVETIIALVVIVGLISILNLILKANYKPIREAKAGLVLTLAECNRSILNEAETFRKNSTDSAAIASIDAAKAAFDSALAYYGKAVKHGTNDGIIVGVLDSCFRCVYRFHNDLESQTNLGELGISTAMLNVMDNNILHMKREIDSLVSGIDSYNESGFILALSWLTPYPSKIEHHHVPLPEIKLSAEGALYGQKIGNG